MGRIHRAERQRYKETGSPLARHSMNQVLLKAQHDREKSGFGFGESKKDLRAAATKHRKDAEEEHDLQKLIRIAKRVEAKRLGYDGVDPEVHAREVRYLIANGINFPVLYNAYSNPDTNVVGL